MRIKHSTADRLVLKPGFEHQFTSKCAHILLVGVNLEHSMKESHELVGDCKKQEAIESCEELREQIEEGRLLLQHVRDVRSESARYTYVSLNKELLILWQKFFARCPKMAKEHLRRTSR